MEQGLAEVPNRCEARGTLCQHNALATSAAVLFPPNHSRNTHHPVPFNAVPCLRSLDATPTQGPYVGYALKSRARITCQTCQKNVANKPTTFVSLAPVCTVCNALAVPWSRASRARALFAELSILEKDDLIAIDFLIIATNVNTFYCFLLRECSCPLSRPLSLSLLLPAAILEHNTAPRTPYNAP